MTGDRRICPVCDTVFRARTWNHTYCSGYRGQCYRRAMNANYRRRPLIKGKVGPDFQCANCDRICSPGVTVAAHATKFCGVKCKRRWHKQREGGGMAAVSEADR